MRWVDKYKSTNNITRKKRDYNAYKISNRQFYGDFGYNAYTKIIENGYPP